jgi:hypothetical protein
MIGLVARTRSSKRLATSGTLLGMIFAKRIAV